ncbi:hypothetical protein [Archangium lipolyticum]|uniref:hypothetical protein n=1 Tax=Archangium lipolyticum TaxID=2970465 RepID=UPI00214A7B1D|nr:hypothetical protein [Archangium lipolyticum]
MDTSTATQQLIATSLCLLLCSCSTTGYAPPGPSGSAELPRYVLVIQEAPDGQMTHAWQPLNGFDLSKLPYNVSNGRFEGPVVRASFNRDCEAERDGCEEMCRASLKGRDWAHASAGSKNAICRERCMPAYLDCSRLKESAEAGRLRVSFPAVDSAVAWLKQHRRELLVGTVVIIAGVAFVVVTVGSGGGALVLAPAILLVSSDAPFTHGLARVEP